MERIYADDSVCITTQKKLVRYKLDKNSIEEYKFESQQEKISCGSLVTTIEGKIGGVAGQENGNLWYWKRPNKTPEELTNYKAEIISIKGLNHYTLIATAGKKFYIWEIPNACIQSVDLSTLELKLISSNTLMMDVRGNEVLIITEKDLIRATIDKGRINTLERLNKIISFSGKRQTAMHTTKNKAIAIANDSGAILVIDTSTNEMHSILQIREIITCLDFNEKRLLAIGTIKGNVYVNNEETNCILLESFKSGVVDIKISPNGNYIVVLLEDHNCVLFQEREQLFEKICQRKLFVCYKE